MWRTAPANSVLPAITGTPTVGQTLTARTGTWTGDATITYAYQWKHARRAIGSATASTYLLVAADEGDLITVTVTATNGAGCASATSAALGPITAAYSAEATAFFARLATQPSSARKTQYDTLITALVAGGCGQARHAVCVRGGRSGDGADQSGAVRATAPLRPARRRSPSTRDLPE